MATKTISIDLEAYGRLTGARRGDESFSKVIKRLIRPAFDVDAYFARLDAAPMSDEALEALECREEQRHWPSTRER